MDRARHDDPAPAGDGGEPGRGGGVGALTPDWRAGGFGVYVHWPFCLSKCPYCDFNSHVAKGAVDHARFARALCAELGAAAARTGRRRVDTVFFGGGTPSLMAPETLAAVMARIDALWGLAPDAEVTLEANPTSVEAGRLRAFADAGANRVSMGAQALNDADLRALGRTHTAAEARRAFDVARAAFDRVSFDLIYARPGQTPEAWAAELRAALAMAVDHLSLYQLTIEPGTRFADLHARGRLRPPDEGRAADLWFLTQEICDSAGLSAYEVSNHARPGAESRHNLVYWRYGDYAGVGPGAHGRLTGANGDRRATVAQADPAAWLAAVETHGESFAESPVSPADQAVEMAMMGLRLTEGIDLERHARLAGAPFDADRIAALAADGLVAEAHGRLAVTARGRPLLDAVLRALLV